MKKILVGLMILTMTLALAGCSNDKKEKPEIPPAQAEEDTKKEEPAAPEEENEAPEQTEEPAHDAAAAKELEASAPLYDGVIRAMYQPDISKDGVSYVPSDSQFFWLCTYFTANQIGTGTDGVTLTKDNLTLSIPADVMKSYAEGCFGDIQSLPEIPQEVTYIKKDGDNYLAAVSDTGDTDTAITKAYKNADGTYTAVIDFSTSEGLLSTYKISFKENPASDAMFKYFVTDAVLVK